MFNTKTIEVPKDLFLGVEKAAKVVGIEVDEMIALAFGRIVKELEETATVIQGDVHVAPLVDDDGHGRPLTIHLNEVQHRVMSDLAEKYVASLEQIAKYGLFYAELPLEPEGSDADSMLQEIRFIQNPEECFEHLHGEDAENVRKVIEAEQKEPLEVH